MSNSHEVDLIASHRYFSVTCFNGAWELMEKVDRTVSEEEEMLRLSITSTWHWTQRPDCTAQNLAVGYWQTSRIYVLLNQATNARRYAKLCLDTAQEGMAPAWCEGFGYEALARAEALAGDRSKRDFYLAEARRLLELVTDEEDRQLLEKDISTVP